MPAVMDSFSEPYTRQGDDISIEQARHNIALLEQQHRNDGIPLSGRIIHVCHYLPITATISRHNTGVLSPPATPPTCTDIPLDDTVSPSSARTECCGHPVWSLGPRYGHSAMISGIRSLSHTHEQLIVGWTGDIMSSADKIPADTVSAEERAAFEDALSDYVPDSDEDEKRDMKYVPVWLDDKVAHGHYDGYCKQSKLLSLPSFKSFYLNNLYSSLAAIPLLAMARRVY